MSLSLSTPTRQFRQGRPNFELAHNVLYVDRGGRPFSWISWRVAAALICQGRTSWHTGESYTVYGGTRGADGERSALEIPAILAGRLVSERIRHTPPLTNPNLFARDRNRCLYCGNEFASRQLTRDHINPRCQGGPDRWANVATACRACNSMKGGRTPRQAGMALLAVPYLPTWSEYLILANRRILADQMDFLQNFLSPGSPCRN